VVQLREHLKSRALPASGTKSELIERLKESLTNEEKILETDDGVLKGSAEAPVATGVTTEEDVLGPQSSPKKTDGDANIAVNDFVDFIYKLLTYEVQRFFVTSK
ncbi:hypothetical protein Tcan_02446, partial [Toxocara canis]